MVGTMTTPVVSVPAAADAQLELLFDPSPSTATDITRP